MGEGKYRVRELARMAKVTVRTLHHYDEIGLLRPAARSRAGYRLYGDDEVARLQQIQIHRALGMPLEAIRAALDDPRFDRLEALRAQRRQLEARLRDHERMIAAIDRTIASVEGGTTMTASELFDGFDPTAHEAEAEQRWGDTEAWAESRRRTQGYGAPEWKALKEEADAIYQRLGAHLAAGAAPTDAKVQDDVRAHREHIDRWFYPCSAAMHRTLADLYDGDARFGANIDRYGDGLAAFLAAAIRAAQA